MIAWKVLADEELLCEGAFVVSMVANSDNDGLENEAMTCGVQLVPLVREKARALLLKQQQEQSESENESGVEQFIEFPIDRDTLAIDRTHKRMKSAVVDADSRTSEWLCRLELQQQAPVKALGEKKSWFDIKIERAGECRVRGNDVFKKEKYKAAIRLYKKALRWLECPADCAYDRDEATLVDPIALACHSNLATSFWKLEKPDQCIKHATLALECDLQSVKALFRRSQALLQTKAFDDAVRDLERASQLEPENRLVRSALEHARAAQTQFNDKQKQAFAKIF